MKALFFLLAALPGLLPTTDDLPDSVCVDGQAMHVQGIALDREAGRMYFSFTSRFVKTDLEGNILGSIDRIQGHLGALAFHPEDRKVYASLECKDDEIGAGIARTLQVEKVSRSGSTFYVAVIDVDRLDRIGMDPEGDDIFRTACIHEACDDYQASVRCGGDVLEHRFGCSGIDGVALAPAPGKKGGPLRLWVAYGIYSDIRRTDNDHQVLLCYDVEAVKAHARPVTFGTLHRDGPAKPAAKYFVYTGNTSYGVQNLAYDPATDALYMAVYRGKKGWFPNYDLFAVPLAQKPSKGRLQGVPYVDAAWQLRPVGTGWYFRWGSTGLCPVGDGRWYISENGRDPVTRTHSCKARRYRWTGNFSQPFVL